MTKIIKGRETADELDRQTSGKVEQLKKEGVVPVLAVVRAGERPDDIAYEKSILKKADRLGIEVKRSVLPGKTDTAEASEVIKVLSDDPLIHGIMVFRPLPSDIDDEAVRRALTPEKDIDGITDGSMAGIYGSGSTGMQGFFPCTAEACMEILRHENIQISGRKAVVLGRSLVIGKPAAMLLLAEDATVTVCHSRTKDTEKICREADILITAAGKAKTAGKGYFRAGQTVIDVGINPDAEGNICGDADMDAAVDTVDAITPVPGGVGTVTASVLMKHVADAACIRK